jgi:hypothetical protein
MFETILSYLSWAVAWQGVFAVGATVYSLVEHFKGKAEYWSTSWEEEKIKLAFFSVWFLLTFSGFYFDAVSSPPFAQAFSLHDSGPSQLLGYASIFGTILCLAIYAPYKIGSSIVYLYKHKNDPKDSGRSPIQFIEDEYYGDMLVMETSFLTMMKGDLELGDARIKVEITYPPHEDLPEHLRDTTRDNVLARSKDLCEQLKLREADHRNGLAYLLSQDESAAGKTLNEIAAGLQLSSVEIEYWFEDEGTELDSEVLELTYSNTNDFSDPELVVGITGDGGVYLVNEEKLSDEESEEEEELLLTDEPAIEQTEQHIDHYETEVEENVIDEAYIDEDDKSIKQSYL